MTAKTYKPLIPYYQAQWMLAGKRSGSGPGPPFDPSTIAGLLAWWKLDTITGLNHGDPISTWADSSGNGHTATNSGAARPLYITNVLGLELITPLGLVGGVYFSSGMSLNIASAFSGGTGPWTVIVALGSSGGDVYSLASTGANNGTLGTSIYSGQYAIAAGTAFSGGASLSSTNVASGQSNGQIWVNGALGTGTTGGPFPTGTFSVIGAYATGFSEGWFKEILAYNSLLGTTDRQNVEGYLKTKYGTP